MSKVLLKNNDDIFFSLPTKRAWFHQKRVQLMVTGQKTKSPINQIKWTEQIWTALDINLRIALNSTKERNKWQKLSGRET